MTSTSSFKQFSLENDMEDVTTEDAAAIDAIYKYDADEQRKLQDSKPWTQE
jgi:hypothetical protein